MISPELDFERQKVEALIELQGVGYWCLDLKTKKLTLSDLFLENLGVSYQQFDGEFKTFYSWLIEEDRESFNVALSYHINDGIPFDMTATFKFPEELEKKYDLKGRAIRTPEGEAVYFIGIAIGRTLGNDSTGPDFQTLLADHQKFLLHSTKMSALGEMASGMAHEINNPLAIIIGKAEILIRALERGDFPTEKVIEGLKRIESAGERTAKIVRGLKNFSREGGQDPFEKTFVKVLVDETLSFCQARFKNFNIRLEIPPIAPEISINCRAGEISQVLLNLLSNSADAIAQRPDPWIRLEVSETEKFVDIVITDCGEGIPAEIAQKIMQPFFTTKPVGKGTGLGLSISKGIIEAHKGELLIDTNCPNTRFIARLPKTLDLGDRLIV